LAGVFGGRNSSFIILHSSLMCQNNPNGKEMAIQREIDGWRGKSPALFISRSGRPMPMKRVGEDETGWEML
jgi:hypothetical protein